VVPELELELGPEDAEEDWGGEEGDEPELDDDDEFDPEPDVVDVPEPVAAPGVPDPPPAADDNCANPTEGGFARNTEYTFFKNVSPTIHPGFPFPLCTLLP
jgi:hypothetical protein